MKKPSPPLYVNTAGLPGTLLLFLCLNERGVDPRTLSDDPDEITCAISTIHTHGYELEMLADGWLCIARDADVPIPGPWRSYFNFVSSIVLDDRYFIRSVLREDLTWRLNRYIEWADRKVEATLPPALTPGTDTLPPIVVTDDEDRDASDPSFDPNTVIAQLA